MGRILTLRCEYCHEPFQARRSDARYCCANHRSWARRDANPTPTVRARRKRRTDNGAPSTTPVIRDSNEALTSTFTEVRKVPAGHYELCCGNFKCKSRAEGRLHVVAGDEIPNGKVWKCPACRRR